MFDLLDELETAIEKVASSEQSVDVERMCGLAERVEFLKVRAIRDYDRSCAWQAEGHVSAAAGLRSKCRMQHGVARRAIELGRKLENLPLVADAFAAGEISRPHAEVIAAAHTPERAAALTSICRWYLAEHDGRSTRRRNQTRVSVVVDLAELAGTNTALLADVRAEAAHAGRLSRATLRRLACDAKISRVLTDGTSQ